MDHKPALYALIKLHAEIGGRIKENAKEAIKLREDMIHVEHVLKLLEPGFSVRRIAAKRKNGQNPWFKRGTIFRLVLGVLKDATAPMSGEEIAVALLRSKGITEPSREDRWRLFGTVDSSLRNNEGKSVIGDDGRPRRWSLGGTA